MYMHHWYKQTCTYLIIVTNWHLNLPVKFLARIGRLWNVLDKLWIYLHDELIACNVKHEVLISMGIIHSCILLLKVCITCFPCHVFLHSLAEWTVPTVTGDIPSPIAHFSFTQISYNKAIMFGGNATAHLQSELYLAAVGRNSVVCENWWWLWVDWWYRMLVCFCQWSN